MSFNIIVIMIVLLLVVFAAITFSRPFKSLARMAAGAVLGGVSSVLLNSLLAPAGIYVGLNVFTLVIMAVLGLPGFIMLYLVNFIL